MRNFVDNRSERWDYVNCCAVGRIRGATLESECKQLRREYVNVQTVFFADPYTS